MKLVTEARPRSGHIVCISKNLSTGISPVSVRWPEEPTWSGSVFTSVGAVPLSHRFQPALRTGGHSRVHGEQNTSHSEYVAFKLRLKLLELEMIFRTCFPTP